ncbi:MAG: hypothetical protein D6820_07930 [Lentisphaerae bacterium]|nr:MAG: hypothetical protein D6820_07930 [Lentisphaerota bacterium]
MPVKIESLIWEDNAEATTDCMEEVILGMPEELQQLSSLMAKVDATQADRQNSLFIANGHGCAFLLLMAKIKPAHCIVFDDNRKNLEWLALLIELIRKCESPQELCERIFLRPQQEKDWKKYLGQPSQASILTQTQALLHDTPELQRLYTQYAQLLLDANPIMTNEHETGYSLQYIETATHSSILSPTSCSLSPNDLNRHSNCELFQHLIHEPELFFELKRQLSLRMPEFYWGKFSDLPIRIWTVNHAVSFCYLGTHHLRHPGAVLKALFDCKRSFFDSLEKGKLFILTAQQEVIDALTDPASTLSLHHTHPMDTDEIAAQLFTHSANTRLKHCPLTPSVLPINLSGLPKITPDDILLEKTAIENTDQILFSGDIEVWRNPNSMAIVQTSLKLGKTLFFLIEQKHAEDFAEEWNQLKPSDSPLFILKSDPHFQLFSTIPPRQKDSSTTADAASVVKKWWLKHSFLEVISNSLESGEVDRAIMAGTEAFHVLGNDPDLLRPYLWAMIQIGAFEKAFNALTEYKKRCQDWDEELEEIQRHLEEFLDQQCIRKMAETPSCKVDLRENESDETE